MTPREEQQAVLKGAQAYFNEGRCSGHAQFNGRYCRDSAGPERWCIHCAGYMLLSECERLKGENERLRVEVDDRRANLEALDKDYGVLLKESRADADELATLKARWEQLKVSAKAGDAAGFKAWTVVGDEITRLEREP